MKKAIAELRVRMMKTGFKGTTEQLEYTIQKFMLSLQVYVTEAFIDTLESDPLYILFCDWTRALNDHGQEASTKMLASHIWLARLPRHIDWGAPTADDKVVSLFGGGG